MAPPGPEQDEPLRGNDGSDYYTIAQAARRIGVPEEALRRRPQQHGMVTLPAEGLVVVPRTGPGRPAKLVINAEAVERERAQRLQSLGAADLGESGAVDEWRRRIDELERSNADLRGRVAALEEAVRLSLVIEQAAVERQRQLLGPVVPPRS